MRKSLTQRWAFSNFLWKNRRTAKLNVTDDVEDSDQEGILGAVREIGISRRYYSVRYEIQFISILIPTLQNRKFTI